MSSKDLHLGIVVDTDTRATKQEFSSLRREVKKEADAMGGDWEAAAQKVEDALREAGARDDLVDAAQRIGREGPSEIEKMQRALKDLESDARDTASDIKRVFGDNSLSGDDLFDANFKAEVQSSARETGGEILGQISGALADGTMDIGTLVTSIGDGLVEIGAEVGGPAGGAMIAGGMIANALWGQITAQKEAVQDAVSSMFDQIMEEGAAAAEVAQIQKNIRDLTEDQNKLNYSNKLAKDLSVELSDVTRARAGDELAMKDVLDEVAQQEEDLATARKNGEISADEYRTSIDRLDTAIYDVTADFDTHRAGIDAAKDATLAAKDATEAYNTAALDQATKLARSSGEAQNLTTTIDGVSTAIRVMPDGKIVKVTDNGTAELTQEEISAIKGGDAFVTVRYRANTAELQAIVDAAAREIRNPTVTFTPSIGYVRG